LPPKKALVDLNDLIKESMFFFEGRCKSVGIDVNAKLSSHLPKITVDSGQINQVLVNLVVNAIQAMPQGGTLTVETRADAVGVYMIVEDTGVGIEEERMSSVFLPFYTTKDVNEGTGLGLAVVHGIVTAHGGEIKVQSNKEEGSRFAVYLPSSR
jgi:signal transduction histidine kinase